MMGTDLSDAERVREAGELLLDGGLDGHKRDLQEHRWNVFPFYDVRWISIHLHQKLARYAE